MTESKPLIVAGADGFGEDLKNVLVEHCRAQGYEVDDLGTGAYYDKAGEVARRVQTDGAKGLLFCGTGMGVGIVANKFSGIQAAATFSQVAARCSRAINDSNVLWAGYPGDRPALPVLSGGVQIAGKGLLSRFCATIREMRDFNRETYGTNRESVTMYRLDTHAERALAFATGPTSDVVLWSDGTRICSGAALDRGGAGHFGSAAAGTTNK